MAMAERTQSQLTQQMVREIVSGIGDTGVRAGIIGEIPAENLTFRPAVSTEVRVLRAAARASRLTGSAVSLHILETPADEWDDVLDILETEGADLTRVVIGHTENFAESKDLAFFESHLERGVYLQFDFLGHPWARLFQLHDLQAIEMLIKAGYSKQLLVSHDVFSKLHLTKNGGDGFTFVHAVLIPYLRNQGVSEVDIKNVLENNPRRILAFAKPQQLKTRDQVN
jgi:phosphotriesterase-related protein